MGAGQKQFLATDRKLRKARERGQVAKSHHLPALCSLVYAMVWILCLSLWLISEPSSLFQFVGAPLEMSADFDFVALIEILRLYGTVVFSLLLLFLCPLWAIVVLCQAWQVGICFSWSALSLNFARLNPFLGLKRCLGLGENGQPMRIVYSVLKYGTFIFGLTIINLLSITAVIGRLLSADSPAGPELVRLIVEAIWVMFWPAVLLMLVYVVMDFLVERSLFSLKMRMDREEVKQEQKESETDPHLRSLRKQAHKELAGMDLISKVRKLSLLVLNR